MAKKTKRGGKAWKAGYSTYKAENRVKKNAIRRLERHIKAYPNDESAKARLEEVRLERPYKRNNVKKGHIWSPEDIRYATLQGQISGSAKHASTYEANKKKVRTPTEIARQLSNLLARKIDEELLRAR